MRGSACGSELLVLAGVQVEGLVRASRIYFVSPVDNCLKCRQSSATSDLRHVCLLPPQHTQSGCSARVETLLVWGCICSRCLLRALGSSGSISGKKTVICCQSALNRWVSCNDWRLAPDFPNVLVPLTKLLFIDVWVCFPSSQGRSVRRGNPNYMVFWRISHLECFSIWYSCSLNCMANFFKFSLLSMI